MDCDLDETKVTRNREKIADEMFEELGYIKIDEFDKDYNKDFIRYQKNNNCILFKLENNKVCKLGNNRNYFNMQELQAINKKVEELEWL